MLSSYSIGAVAERTGLTPHVIRAWERRYGAIDPDRSPGKHRLYSDLDIERLSLLHRAVRNGHSIGKIAGLATDDLRTITASHEEARSVGPIVRSDDSAAQFRSGILGAIIRFDDPALEEELRNGLLALGHQRLIRLVISPVAVEIGERWRTGELTAAHEHFFTASVKVFLGEVSRQFATPLTAPRIIFATPTGQLHELGAVMASAIAANLGWRPIYLGPSLPAYEIAGAALRNEAAAVALSIIYPENDPNVARELTELAKFLSTDARILVGGRAARGFFEVFDRIGAIYVESLEEFGAELEAIHVR